METTQPLTTDTVRQQEHIRQRAYEIYEQRAERMDLMWRIGSAGKSKYQILRDG